MATNSRTVHPPFSRKGKTYVALTLVLLLLLWIIALRAYTLLPASIPQHFTFTGHPTSYGGKEMIWIITAAFSSIPMLFLAIIRWRFTLIERFPYFLSLPAFFIDLRKLPSEEQAMWLNRYFELLAQLGFSVSVILLLLETEIFFSMAIGYTIPWLSFAATGLLLLLLGLFIWQLRRLSLALQHRLKHKQSENG